MALRLWSGLRRELASAVHDEVELACGELRNALRVSVGELRDHVESELAAARDQRGQQQFALGTTLERVTEALDGLAEKLDTDQRERSALIGMVEAMLRELAVARPVPVGEPDVLGGTIEPDWQVEATPSTPIADDERQRPPTLGSFVEVWLRFQNCWTDGFQVSEVIESNGERQYRLRRLSDRAVLPVLFERSDVRVKQMGVVAS